MDTDGTTFDQDPGLQEAARRLRERLADAEKAEAHARERAESLRIALREVEALAAPPPRDNCFGPETRNRNPRNSQQALV